MSFEQRTEIQMNRFSLARKGERVLIIAEAGVNHNGCIDRAKNLIDAAVDAEADFVKFQSFITEDEISRKAPAAEYQRKNAGAESQFDMVKRLEISADQHRELMAYCASKGIGFLSSPFEHRSIDLLASLKLPFLKIPSGEINNLPYLRHVVTKKLPVILSTGMSNLTEVQQAVHILTDGGLSKEELILLHCNTEYPTPYCDVNLNAMQTIAEACGVAVGYSDHTLGVEVAIAAVAMGACCIEKHFTLDRNDQGPDHAASLEPQELKYMVACIRKVEQALGSTIKKPSDSEQKNIAIARKSVHATRDLLGGTVITANDLIMKRPGTGISPMQFEQLIGRKLKRKVEEDQMFNWDDFD